MDARTESGRNYREFDEWVRKFTSLPADSQVVGAEGIGQQTRQRDRAGAVVDTQIRAAVLVEHLPAAPARHQNSAARVAYGNRQQPATTRRTKVTDEYSFSTETEAV